MLKTFYTLPILQFGFKLFGFLSYYVNNCHFNSVSAVQKETLDDLKIFWIPSTVIYLCILHERYKKKKKNLILYRFAKKMYNFNINFFL